MGTISKSQTSSQYSRLKRKLVRHDYKKIHNKLKKFRFKHKKIRRRRRRRNPRTTMLLELISHSASSFCLQQNLTLQFFHCAMRLCLLFHASLCLLFSNIQSFDFMRGPRPSITDSTTFLLIPIYIISTNYLMISSRFLLVHVICFILLCVVPLQFSNVSKTMNLETNQIITPNTAPQEKEII